MYIEPYAWRQSDIKLQCSFCSHTEQVAKGRQIPQELETFASKGWRYLGCPRCLNGFLKIYIQTKTGKWRFKSKTLYTEAINWKAQGERGSGESLSS